jgi:hypothetical protein
MKPVIGLAALTLIAGCSTPQRNNLPTDSRVEVPASIPSPSVRFDDGYSVSLGMSEGDLISRFGPPQRSSATAAEFLSRGFAVIFDKQRNVVAIFGGDACLRGSPPTESPLVAAFQSAKVEGLRIYASPADVEARLGRAKAEHLADGIVSLTYAERGLTFTLRDDRVVYVMIRRIHGQRTKHSPSPDTAPASQSSASHSGA